MTKLVKRKSVLYGCIVLISLVLGASLTYAVVTFSGTPTIPQLSLFRDVAGGCCHQGGVGVRVARQGGAGGFARGNGRNVFALISVDPSISNGSPIIQNGYVVQEQVDGTGVPVLMTQDSYYLLQSSQPIPANAYVTVSGSLYVYSISPYSTANVCSPFDCAYLILQIQVSQFTVLYQGS